MAVIVVIGSRTFALALREDEGCPGDISHMRRGVEVLEMVEEGRDGDGKGALVVGRKDQRWAAGFMKVVVVIGRGVAGDAITGAEDGVLGE